MSLLKFFDGHTPAEILNKGSETFHAFFFLETRMMEFKLSLKMCFCSSWCKIGKMNVYLFVSGDEVDED